jgi:hypothetical protein
MAGHTAAPDVTRAARIQAGLALVPAAAATFYWFNSAGPSAGLAVFFAGLTAAPLAAPPSAFAGTCLVVSAIIAAAAVFGAPLGLFVFLPSALIVLMAGLAGRYPSRRTAALVASALVTLAAMIPFAEWASDHFFPASDVLIVQESVRGSVNEWGLLRSVTATGIKGLSVATWATSRELAVESQGSLPARDRQLLLGIVRATPGVAQAHWCEGTQCDG